jgi:uncharacterized repeat protein (TIGR03803 family)
MASLQTSEGRIFSTNSFARTVAKLIVLALTTSVSFSAQAQTYHVIYNFTGGTDGAHPQASLAMDRAGNIYGTTPEGGQVHFNCYAGSRGCGTVFKLTREDSRWLFGVLHSFAGKPQDGDQPYAKLTISPDGSVYGSTSMGGDGNCSPGFGCGTVFKLTVPPSATAEWKETIFHYFQGPPDGFYPWGDLTLDPDGNVYGTTWTGGSGSGCGPNGCGVVYRLTHSVGGWSESILYAFGYPDSGPWMSGVIFDQAGNLYGTSGEGGFSYGTVYELMPSGSSWVETVLHAFSGGVDGGFPAGTLLRDQSGNMYGGATQGGAYGHGVVYELTPSVGGFTLNVLYAFTACCGPGETLSMDSSGSLYDTASGGAYGKGSVFKLMPAHGGWTYTDLHDFTGGTDGGVPDTSVLIDQSGSLYGTTSMGGAYGQGVVWEITP